jgi:ribosomal protein S18 acetylase RimI-like enzyme
MGRVPGAARSSATGSGDGRASLEAMPDVDALDAAERALLGPDATVLHLRPAGPDDAGVVHALYLATPAYFDAIGKPVPTPSEVRTDLILAERDDRRRVVLAVLDGSADGAALPADVPRDAATGAPVVAYLDYKVDYPDVGDATVNLLLVHGALQSRGYGAAAVAELEERLRGRVHRVLASIYGSNPRAKRFWERLGYRFAIDARPVLEWFGKRLDA